MSCTYTVLVLVLVLGALLECEVSSVRVHQGVCAAAMLCLWGGGRDGRETSGHSLYIMVTIESKVCKLRLSLLYRTEVEGGVGGADMTGSHLTESKSCLFCDICLQPTRAAAAAAADDDGRVDRLRPPSPTSPTTTDRRL